MKVRDSGMPPESVWTEFFNSDELLYKMQINSSVNHLVEIGCGYGTFTIPTAKIIGGILFAFDIEEEMIVSLSRRLEELQIKNVVLEKRDILVNTTGLPAESADYVMLFNILHNEKPMEFLDEACRILRPGGKAGIVHWRSDIDTPRGPDDTIRPTPDKILEWIDNSKFFQVDESFHLGSYHFGMMLMKI